MTYKLSILIPSRNEVCYEIDLLKSTIRNLLAHTTDDCEIIAVLDGWTPKSITKHPRVTYIHHNKSIGQRAATNEAARVAQGEWVCKMDAHVAVSNNFDVDLLKDAEPDWTIVPAQYNLLAFNWKCSNCGRMVDQSPKPPACELKDDEGKVIAGCGAKEIEQVKQWFPRDGREGSDVGRGSGRRQTYMHCWRFDTKLEYCPHGFGDYVKRNNIQTPSIHDTMSLLGACWAIRKDRYFDLNICDERYGSWGQQGTEVACKSWLSGGRLVSNSYAWFAHFFRVGGLHFPYPDGGMKERAMARCREMWLENKWEKQVRPLSWMIEHFWPVPDWSVDGHPMWAAVKAAGKKFTPRPNPSFSSLGGGANLTTRDADSCPSAISHLGVGMTPRTVSSPNSNTRDGVSPLQVVPVISEKRNVSGVTAGLVITDNVIENGDTPTSSSGQGSNQPSVHEPVAQLDPLPVSDMPVAPLISGATPNPASVLQDFNFGKQASQSLSVKVTNSQQGVQSHGLTIPQRRKGILYYSCLSHDETLELAARNNLKSATNGHELGCVTLNERVDFGDWQMVVQRQKSGTTMHYQILEGLRRSTADYVFLCESDVFYHKSHFDFVPPRDDTVYYNTNVWRVRYQDGHAVRTDGLQQVSGICANRALLVEHYRRRIELIEANGGVFDIKKYAYEPGTRGNFDDTKVENWDSEFPNIDVTGHGKTLTKPKFSIDEFRNKKYSIGWQETDDQLPGWPKLSGRIQEWLEELAYGKREHVEPAQ